MPSPFVPVTVPPVHVNRRIQAIGDNTTIPVHKSACQRYRVVRTVRLNTAAVQTRHGAAGYADRIGKPRRLHAIVVTDDIHVPSA